MLLNLTKISLELKKKIHRRSRSRALAFVGLMCFMQFGFHACQSGGKGQKHVLILDASGVPDSLRNLPILLPDTIEDKDPLQIYSKAVQRFGAGLLYLDQQLEEDSWELDGVKILDLQGQPVTLSLSQEQRDSVVMEYLQFTRTSATPYRQVKNFELRVMTVR